MASKLDIVDVVVLVVSLLVSTLIGLYFANKNKSLNSYMLGDRKMSVLPVAISLMTSCMSGLTLLGSSSELYYQGPTYAFVAVSILLSGPITAYTILPVFYRMNELSLYKYLEMRYGLMIKYIVTIVYILQMIFYNSVVLYLPAMALQAIFGVSRFYSILLIGLMCVLYSVIGGIKAVIWTDLFQAALMYTSIIIVGLMGTYDAGGFFQVFKYASEGGRLDLDGFFNMDLTTRHTLLGIMLGSTLKHVYIVGVNQVQIQRAISLPSLKQGQNSFVYCSLFTALVSLLSTYMGFVMYSTYQSCDPFLDKQIPRRDAIVVHYVSNKLGRVTGLRGIFIAGIFSATLSTLSSFANSMAALTLEDFIKPLMRRLGHKEPNGTKMAKYLATGYGLLCVIMAYGIDKANSRLLQTTTTMFGAIGVPFLASFALGIFTRYTNTIGILTGIIVTLSLGLYISIYQIFFIPPLEPLLPVYYNQQCEQIFNATMSPKLLPPLRDIFDESVLLKLPPVKVPFSIEEISYMILPVVQFMLTIMVASVVSLMTGGWNQEVNDEYLVYMKRSNSTVKRKPMQLVDRTICNSCIETNTNNLTNSHCHLNLSLRSHPIDTACSRKRKLGVINRGFDDDDSGKWKNVDNKSWT